jgi:hypothetical protein
MVNLKEIAVSLLAKPVTEATEKITESWSGSSMGYHSELYYRDFERPPLGAEFSPEWGGINGIPVG